MDAICLHILSLHIFSPYIFSPYIFSPYIFSPHSRPDILDAPYLHTLSPHILIFHKRATNCRALLQKMTYEDKASYGCRYARAVELSLDTFSSHVRTCSHPTLALTYWTHLIPTHSRPTYSLPTYSRPTYSRPTFSRPDVLALMHSP